MPNESSEKKPELPSDQRERIIQKLGALIKRECPLCGNMERALVDGYILLSVSNDIRITTLGGPSVPCVAAICTKCGFVSMHAMGVIGLLGSEDKPHGPENE